jgi:hypothetical protein
MAETSRLLLEQDWRSPLLIDGLAYGAFPTGMAAGLAGRVVALCHHPLCLETGMAPARASVLRRLETAALGYAAAVIVTGEATRDLLVAEFGVPAGRVTVAEPGVEPAARAAETPFGQPLRLLAVGSIIPRKGYDLLIDALAPLAGLPWTLRIIGAAAIARFPNRMINIHPSLLPRHPGLHTHQRALEAGDAEHGASVHVVIPELDAGPVLAQVRVPVHDGDTAETLAARVLAREHPLLLASVAAVAGGALRLDADAIRWQGAPLREPLRLGDDDRLHAAP